MLTFRANLIWFCLIRRDHQMLSTPASMHTFCSQISGRQTLTCSTSAVSSSLEGSSLHSLIASKWSFAALAGKHASTAAAACKALPSIHSLQCIRTPARGLRSQRSSVHSYMSLARAFKCSDQRDSNVPGDCMIACCRCMCHCPKTAHEKGIPSPVRPRPTAIVR
jgi:hypothetical protein